MMMDTKQESLRLYGALIDAFIQETRTMLTKEELVRLMNVVPIMHETTLVGVMGLTVEKTKVGKAAIIRMLYIEPKFRGKHIWSVFFRLFAKLSEQGFSHVEGWAYPRMSKWLAKRLRIVPKLYVYHENLSSLLARMQERARVR